MAKQYVVTGHMANFDTTTDQGRMRVTFYRGARVPEDANPAQIEHNLSVGLITEVSGDESIGVDAAGAVVVGTERLGTEGQPGEEIPLPTGSLPVDNKAKTDAEVDEKRAAAKAKLPEGGAAPDGRAAQPVWVEYLVSRGSRYEDVKDAEKADLVELAKQQS